MRSLGPTELIIILVIVVILFGAGRISKVAGEMGKGIKAFKAGLGDSMDDDKTTEDKPSEKSI